MIEKLTTEQEAYLHQLEQENIRRFWNWGKVDRGEIEKAVERLYLYAGLSKPKIVYWNDGQTVESVEQSVWQSLLQSVEQSVEQSVLQSVWQSVRQSVWQSVWQSVDQSVLQSVEQSVRQSVEQSVLQSVWQSVRQSVEQSVLQSVRQSVWHREDEWTLTYMNFWDSVMGLGEDWKKYQEVYKAGFMFLFFFRDTCIVIEMPEKIEGVWNGERWIMHSDEKPAITLAGMGLYYLNGVQFPKDLWQKVVSRTMPFKDILAIEDIDQRTQAMRYGDVREFLSFAGAKTLDTYTKETLDGVSINYALYEIPARNDLFRETAYYVVYDCPSTGRVYMSGVEKPRSEGEATVAHAMAWKQNITSDEWLRMIPLVHES